VNLLTAKGSFIGKIQRETYEIREGDLFESDHPVVEKWPELFGPVPLRYPVDRKAAVKAKAEADKPEPKPVERKIEQATAAPGERRWP